MRGGEGVRESEEGKGETHGVVDNVLSPRVVVDVDGDAAQGRHLGRQLVQPRVVLSLALVGLRHVGR